MADDAAKFTQANLDKIKADADARIEAMDNKVQQALDEAKKAKAEARKLKEIDPADLARLEEENESLRTELSAAQKQVKDSGAALEKALKQIETESGFTSKLLTENALNTALADAGVKEPAMLKAVKAMFAGTAQVITEGDQRIVQVGGKPLPDYIKEWAGTDEAKHFISAAHNNGTGAPGGQGGASSKTVTRAAFNTMDPAAQMAFSKEGGKVVDQAA